MQVGKQARKEAWVPGSNIGEEGGREVTGILAGNLKKELKIS
jgi:hypothetical protein